MFLQRIAFLSKQPIQLFTKTRFSRSTTTSTTALQQNIKVFIDGKPIHVPPDVTIIQACEAAGVEIPRFCYHARLKIAGNCRMCLVQVERMPKPIASCAQPVAPGMRVITDSPVVKKAREGVMEFLLANHPLDCVICDQGGECDLQDQAMAYGSDRSRFPMHLLYGKRAVEDKDFGPLVKTSMNRCIHCTRCVRFANDVAGVPDLGTTGRGNEMQISMYIERMLDSELSGNVIDLCPVGALTSRPYAFMARPWELKRTPSIDVMDAVQANIRVDSRGEQVMRVLPRLNDAVNEEWLADKGRFACDGLSRQRLLEPAIRRNGRLVNVTWNEALAVLAKKLVETRPEDIQVLAGPFVDVETVKALADLFGHLGVHHLDFDGPRNDLDLHTLHPALHRIPSIEAVEHADAVLLVGTNPRHEAPLLNARIRKAFLNNGANIYYIGPYGVDLSYEYEHLGVSSRDILKATSHLKSATRPLVLVGQHVIFGHPCYSETLSRLGELVASLPAILDASLSWKGFGVLPQWASRTGALRLKWGNRPNPSAKLSLLWTADDLSSLPSIEAPSQEAAFVVYCGHHGDIAAERADLLLPTAAYTEKDSLWINCEGRWQCTQAAVSPPGNTRPDWAVVRALSEYVDAFFFSAHGQESRDARRERKERDAMTLPYDTLEQLRETLPEHVIGQPNDLSYDGLAFFLQSFATSANSKRTDSDYTLPIKDYYLTDCISRNSETMAKCSLAFTRHAFSHTHQIDVAVAASHEQQ